jgi:hypothetical protein
MKICLHKNKHALIGRMQCTECGLSIPIEDNDIIKINGKSYDKRIIPLLKELIREVLKEEFLV